MKQFQYVWTSIYSSVLVALSVIYANRILKLK